jgi:hypothetical protein
MTKRTCPWCGGPNLILRNCSGDDPKRDHASYLYWEDRDCGYREKTSHDARYDKKTQSWVPCEMEVYEIHKPRPPLPAHQQPAYLRYGLHQPEPVEAEQGQQTLRGMASS